MSKKYSDDGTDLLGDGVSKEKPYYTSWGSDLRVFSRLILQEMLDSMVAEGFSRQIRPLERITRFAEFQNARLYMVTLTKSDNEIFLTREEADKFFTVFRSRLDRKGGSLSCGVDGNLTIKIEGAVLEVTYAGYDVKLASRLLKNKEKLILDEKASKEIGYPVFVIKGETTKFTIRGVN